MEAGYRLEKKFFSHKKIKLIKNDMEKIFSHFDSESGDVDKKIIRIFEKNFDAFIGCSHLCQKLPSVYALASDSRIIKYLKKIGLSFPVMNTKPLVSFSSKKTSKSEFYWKVPAHQDFASNLGSDNGVTCWIPLVNINHKLGPLEIAPYSQNYGLLEHHGTPPILINSDFKFVSMPMNIGDVLFFNTKTVHKSGVNLTDDEIRWSLHFRYNDADDVSFVEKNYPRNRTND